MIRGVSPSTAPGRRYVEQFEKGRVLENFLRIGCWPMAVSP